MAQETRFLEHFINKSVGFRFQRQGLQFHLSQSLFSSNDVDDGTKRLLKTMSRELDLADVRSLLDLGCGVGVLGICLKKRYPEMEVVFQDRDALALAFTELNCSINELGSVTIKGDLALQGMANRRFDLIASNLPGKAGTSVLRDILSRIPGHLTQRGIAAVVVVNPLVGLVQRTLAEINSVILHQEVGGGHAIFHYRGEATPAVTSDPWEPYLRGSFPFKVAGHAFEQATVHNLAEFDTLSYQTRLAITAIKDEQVAGKGLFWNPGQGHVAVFLALKSKEQISEYVLASRDLLSLQASRHNLMAHRVGATKITLAHLPHFLRIEDQLDFVVLMPDIDPGVPWHRYLLKQCQQLLAPGGKAIITTRSGFMHRILTMNPGLNVTTSKKRWGYRCIIVQKAG